MSMTVTMVPLRGPLMNGQIMTPLEKIQHSQNKCMFHWGVAPFGPQCSSLGVFRIWMVLQMMLMKEIVLIFLVNFFLQGQF